MSPAAEPYSQGEDTLMGFSEDWSQTQQFVADLLHGHIEAALANTEDRPI